MTRGAAALFIAVALVASPLAAQTPRDTSAAPGGPAVSLTGTIVEDAPGGAPIRRALVTIREASTSTGERQTATDDQGRFTLTGLPAGSYLVEAGKPGYVTGAYGSRAPLAPGTPVAVGPEQSADVVVRLMRGAAVEGSARGCGGFGGNARAQAYRAKTIAGERRFVPVGPNVVLDDRGAFRLWGLPPGEYIVQAGPTTITPSETRLTTADEVAWATAEMPAPAAGTAPGAATRRSEPPPGRPVAIAPCYYPGTADESAAQVIRLEVGEERTGLDFQIDFVPAAVITGTVVGVNGAPVASPRISWTRRTPLQIALPNAGVQVQAEGRFVIPRIYPGQYELSASSGSGTGPGEPRGFATLDLNVNGQDLSNLVIRLQPGSTVSGRVAFDGKSAPPAASDATVRLTPVSASAAPDSGISTAVQADGTFALRDVPPGRYRVAATAGGAANWTLQSAMIAGVESLDTPVEIRVGQSIDDGVVRFTDVRTQLRGAILDAAGRRVSGYSLVAFSTDARLWQTSARRVHHRKAATDGTYSFDLTPGEYFLAAAGELTDEQASDSAILEALAGAAIRVTVAAGEQKTLDVRMGQ